MPGIPHEKDKGMSQSWVYMMSNRPRGVIYTGVTSDLPQRVYEHKNNITPGFASKHGLKQLVWFETHPNIVLAIKREKGIKNYPREWKINLIEGLNPSWNDLFDQIFNIENQFIPNRHSPNYDDYF